MKHTPGPWRWEGESGRWLTRAMEPLPWINSILTCDEQNGEPSEADARLIAAAPELLEAAKMLAYQWKLVDPDAIEKLRQLIKRIEGE